MEFRAKQWRGKENGALHGCTAYATKFGSGVDNRRLAQSWKCRADARLLILRALPTRWGCPFFRVFCEARESEMPAPCGFDHVSTTKSNSTRSIAAHPCKKRKDGAPSVRMVQAKIVKGGPPAATHSNFYLLAPPRKRLPHSPRFSASGYHGPIRRVPQPS